MEISKTMKVKFEEWGEENVGIILIPETIEDIAKLLRYARNASAEKPRVFLYYGKEVRCEINLNKYKKSVQVTAITPYKK